MCPKLIIIKEEKNIRLDGLEQLYHNLKGLNWLKRIPVRSGICKLIEVCWQYLGQGQNIRGS
jgi:hypothetical protein